MKVLAYLTKANSYHYCKFSASLACLHIARITFSRLLRVGPKCRTAGPVRTLSGEADAEAFLDLRI